MKILVTSGGTKVPIDRVRHIGNMSHGTFGSKIALQLLRNAPYHGHPKALSRLTFLHARYSKTPFSLPVDVSHDTFDQEMFKVTKMRTEFVKYHQIYKEVSYGNFDEYAKELRTAAKVGHYDVIVLAAAVSDYLVKNYVNGKIRSSEALNIELEPAPKLIGEIRKLSPKTKLVGFKLLVNSKDKDLIAAAQKSAVDNDCIFVVANDLRDIVMGKHRILLVGKEGLIVKEESDPFNSNRLADLVAKAIWIWMHYYDKKSIAMFGGLSVACQW